jgi:hypothetical protein
VDNTSDEEASLNWTHYVRTSGHGLNKSTIERTIKDAEETHLFGIEVDNDPPGRYESFLDPTEKLEALKILSRRVHEISNYAFVYIAGLECITARADQTEHTFFKDHPDWVQRDISDHPAMFGGGDAFWIREGDEDVWISPYAKEWRNIYMDHVRKIAETGIDGIYVDIPYWMTHFKGWEDTWASFDIYTIEAFREKTGLDAKKDLKLGDFTDPNFRKWVDFRIESLTEFMAEVSENAKSINPEIKVIAEIYPGIDESAVRVGADVYEMYQVVDVIAHEFSGGGGNAANKNPLNWFSRMAGMYTFRAFAEGKASWMLSYSWEEKNKVKPSEAMKNLALSNLMAGTNCWDARGHVMSGSNDIETRKLIYKWIAEHEKLFYMPRKPIQPIGIYFSPKTRNYFAKAFMKSYLGMLYMMLQNHLEFEVVTPRTLEAFKGEILILADVKCISQNEVASLKKYLDSGYALIVTGESGKYDETGLGNKVNPIKKMIKEQMSAKETNSIQEPRFTYYMVCPGKKYHEYCKREYNNSAWSGNYQQSMFMSTKDELLTELQTKYDYQPAISVTASPFISAQIAQIGSKPHIFLANFKGLKKNEITKQIEEENITIGFPNKEGAKIYFLPFLGKKVEITGHVTENQLRCVLPPVEKGAVIWME